MPITLPTTIAMAPVNPMVLSSFIVAKQILENYADRMILTEQNYIRSMLGFINWNPNPDAIQIGSFAIKWYGVMWSLGLFIIFYLGTWVMKRLKLDDDKLTTGIQYVFFGALIGARLGQVFFYEWDYFSANPSEILLVWNGGLASHGGIIGATIGLWLFCRTHPEFPFFFAMDMAYVMGFIIAPLIRLGNLLNSEIVGKPTDVPWAFIFVQVDNVPRHPVVLYESLAYFMLVPVLIFAFNKYTDQKPGLYTMLFFLYTFSVRFLLEFFKEPDGGFYFNMVSKTQLLNVPFILTGLVLLYLMLNNKLSYRFPPKK
jgi:prolipoprotein diacylglyceryl transferase